jgi:transcriptional repressor NrdR
LYRLGTAEVESRVIGEMVMDRLRKLDDIAYIRFASVYRSYPDIRAMRQEMDHLLQSDQQSQPAKTRTKAGGQTSAPINGHSAREE